MTSVRHTSGDYLSSTTLPTMTGAWTILWWIKCNSGEYGGAGENCPFGIGTSGGGSEGLLLDVGISANTTLTAVAFRDAAADLQSVNVLTGSDVGWVCCMWRHAAGSASYRFSYRRENVTTWTTTTLTLAAQITAAGGQIRIGSDQFDEHAVDSQSRHFTVQEVEMSDAAALAASQSLNSAPAGTNLHWLDLDSPTNAGVNGGTAGNWTVTGTLTSDASEPSEAGAASVPKINRADPVALRRDVDAALARSRVIPFVPPVVAAVAPPVIYGARPRSLYQSWPSVPYCVGSQLIPGLYLVPAGTIYPTSIASAEAFGSDTVNHGLSAAGGIASAEAFGSDSVNHGLSGAGGIASAEAFGTSAFGLSVAVTGVGSAEAFGTDVVGLVIAPSGIASGEALGAPSLVSTVAPGGIASAESFGGGTVTLTVAPGGIASSETFGAPNVSVAGGPQTVSPVAIASDEAFGTDTVILTVAPGGIASGEALGTPAVSLAGGPQTISPVAIASDETFGAPSIVYSIAPSGVSTAEAFGLAAIALLIQATGIPSAEAFGGPGTVQTVQASGIASGETFGVPGVGQAGTIAPAGIASAEAFGLPVFTGAATVSPTGIASVEAFGLVVFGARLSPPSIASEEAFGTALAIQQLLAVGIASGQAFGTAVFDQPGYVLPLGIASAEVFGALTVLGPPAQRLPIRIETVLYGGQKRIVTE